jgi:hypothetical protein
LQRELTSAVQRKIGEGTSNEGFLPISAERALVQLDLSISPAAVSIGGAMGVRIASTTTTRIGAWVNTAKSELGSTAIVFGLGGIGLKFVQGLRLAGARMTSSHRTVVDHYPREVYDSSRTQAGSLPAVWRGRKSWRNISAF